MGVIRENQRAAAALGIPGAYGGGREGVQRAVYETARAFKGVFDCGTGWQV